MVRLRDRRPAVVRPKSVEAATDLVGGLGLAEAGRLQSARDS